MTRNKLLTGIFQANEMVQGPRAHLQLHETSTVVLDRLNVIIDKTTFVNVVSSGSVHPCLSEVHETQTPLVGKK
jgi:hypothetical protein